MTKTCTDCNYPKDLSEFNFKNKAKDQRSPICRVCWSERAKGYYKRNKKDYLRRTRETKIRLQGKIFEYLCSHPCVQCPESDPACLEFDHVNGKNCEISRMLNNHRSWEAIQAEIALCEVRCSNCHRKKTAKQNGWYKIILNTPAGTRTQN